MIHMMNYRFNTYMLIAASLFLSACSKVTPGGITYTNDIESAFAWTDCRNNSINYSPDAHSGIYVCKIDSTKPYSATFSMKVEDISKKQFKKLTFSSWILVADQHAEPCLILEIRDNTGKTVEWLPYKITGDKLHPRKWDRFETTFNLEENNRLQPSNVYRVYVSNGKADYALVDDIELSFTN